MAQDEYITPTPEMIGNVASKFGYSNLIGMKIVTVGEGIGRVAISVDERLMHPQMIVHGGVIFTLADTAMSMALISVFPAGTSVSTIEAKVNYLLPVREGELLAEATITHQGRSIAVTEATVFNIVNSERKAVAKVLGTFSIRVPKTA
jgi:acyl-CoA thioesterase